MRARLSEQDKKRLFIKEGFIKTFYGILSAARIHQENNTLLIEGAKEFIRLLHLLSRVEGSVTIQFAGKRIHVSDEKLIYRPETTITFDNLLDYFEKRKLFSITFYPNIDSENIRKVILFARILNNLGAQTDRDPDEYLNAALSAENMEWVEIKTQSEPDSELDEKKEIAKRTYSHVLASVKEVGEKLSQNRPAGMHRTIRVVQNMVDLIMEDDPLFKALSTIRIYDDYTYTHSVNVSILSMCVGKRILLSRKSLELIGLCGLLHDLGKIEVPKAILNKQGKLTDEEFEIMKNHSKDSVRLITKIHADRNRKANILLPPFEHHLKYDLSGYPQTTRKKGLSLFGRIICISDVYDAITSPRIYRPTVFSPDRALGLMLNGSGKDFDPVLLKVFINMMGVYPVGTLLKLDKGVGLVTERFDDGNGQRPWVVMLKTDKSGEVKKGKLVNLADKDPKTGKFVRNIVASFHPAQFGIQPAQFLV